MMQSPIKAALPLRAIAALDMAQVEADQIAALAELAAELLHGFRASVAKHVPATQEAGDWRQITALLSAIEDKARAMGKACNSDLVEAGLEIE